MQDNSLLSPNNITFKSTESENNGDTDMRKRIATFLDRETTAQNIAVSFREYSHNVLLVGNHGSGKKYIISKVAEGIQKNRDFSVLYFVGDQLVEVGEKYKATKSEFSFSLSIYLGISWNEVEKNNTKTNYILNCLRTISSKNILIAIPDFQKCPSEVKDLLYVICKNQMFFQEQLNKKISLIVSSMYAPNELAELFEIYELFPYTVEDIKQYIKSVLGYREYIEDENIKFERMQEICSSDLNLVNLLYRDLLQNSANYAYSLSELVKRRLSNLKSEGAKSSGIPSKCVGKIINKINRTVQKKVLHSPIYFMSAFLCRVS